MQIYRIETTVQPEGVLTLRNLPFQAGERVEVVIHVHAPVVEKREGSPSEGASEYPLRGTPYTYIDPFEPSVSEDDWEVLR